MPALGRIQALIERFKASGLGRFLEKYGRDEADDLAALIAFSALFSLFPLIGGLLALLGLVIRDQETYERLVTTIERLFPSELGTLLSFLQETRQITGILGVLSLIGLLWSGSAIFGTMAKAFNRFYQLPSRGFVREKLMSFAMIFVFLGLIIVSVSASSLGTLLLGFSAERAPLPLPALGPLQSLIGWAAALGSAFLMFLAVYWVVPNARMRLGGIWRGALLAAVLFVIITQLFPLYLRFFGGGFAAYKTLGLFLLLMTWFYFLARILVLGAELNAFLDPVQTAAPDRAADGSRTPLPESGPTRRLAGTALAAGLVLLVAQRLLRR